MDHANLTPLGLFFAAGPVVQCIVLLLVAASIWAWVVILEGSFRILRLRAALKAAEAGGTLEGTRLAAVEAAGQAASREVTADEGLAFTKSQIEAAMRRKAAEILEAAEGGLPTLAIIASSAPFIGLLGTVWGIMTSFIGIAASKDTSLAVVAPGIAEALAATAIGLAAAIPAAIGYNRIGAALSRAGKRLGRLIDARAANLARATGNLKAQSFRQAAE